MANEAASAVQKLSRAAGDGPVDYYCFSCGKRAPTEGGHVSCPDWNPPKSAPSWKIGAGHLYFIAAADGSIKIGRSHNPKARMVSLQVSSPQKLRLVAIIEDCGDMEGRYHSRFAAHRLRGEWFAPHPDILAEIDRLVSLRPKRGCSPAPALTKAKGGSHG